MIAQHDNLFTLNGEGFTCLLRINRYSLPELIHFGAPVSAPDAGVLAPNPSLGWGASVLLDDSDTTSCPDALPLEWSGCGRGDYRESPMELEN